MSDPAAAIEDCTHHWILTAPRGDVTAAVCKRCGASRDFLDSRGNQPWRVTRARKPQ